MTAKASLENWLETNYPPLAGVRLNLRLSNVSDWPTASQTVERNPTDRALINHLRKIAEVIVTGSKTALDEGYLPSKWAPIAVVSRSLQPLETQLFAQAPSGKHAPLLLTVSGEETSDPRVIKLPSESSGSNILATLRVRGFNRILLETGPNLTKQLLESVDEICLTSDSDTDPQAIIWETFSVRTRPLFSEIRDQQNFSRWAISRH
jgi:hypothetical protein